MLFVRVVVMQKVLIAVGRHGNPQGYCGRVTHQFVEPSVPLLATANGTVHRLVQRGVAGIGQQPHDDNARDNG